MSHGRRADIRLNSQEINLGHRRDVTNIHPFRSRIRSRSKTATTSFLGFEQIIRTGRPLTREADV